MNVYDIIVKYWYKLIDIIRYIFFFLNNISNLSLWIRKMVYSNMFV